MEKYRKCNDCGKRVIPHDGILCVCKKCFEVTEKNPYLYHPITVTGAIMDFRASLILYGQESANDFFGDHIK